MDCGRAPEDALGPLEILVNNAGLLKPSFLGMMSEAAWDENARRESQGRVVAVQKGRARVAAAQGRDALSTWRARPRKPAKRWPRTTAPPKAGLIGLTKATARELAPANVTCNAIAPGWIETAMTANDNEKKRAAQLALVPLKRLGRAEEVAALAVYLASDEAAYVTGQVFAIDGGLRM